MIQRHILQYIQAAMGDTPVVLLNGARQTGKTTLARMIAERNGAAYFTLDDAATLASANMDPIGFIRNIDGPVVIDEIQKSPELFSSIKLAVDNHRTPGRFLLTGSANVLTLPRLSESLAGRMEIIPLYPFSAGELQEIREPFLERLFEGRFSLGHFPAAPDRVEEMVVRGGYPEVVQRESDQRRSAWFASYISTLLYRDVRDLARVDMLQSLPNLLKLLAARSSGLLNLADVGRDAGLSYTTLTRYLALLETIFLIHRLPAWSPNLGKRLVKTPKVHLVDTGLACHLIGADTNRLAGDRTLMGRILETFVVGELRKQISWADPRIALYHFRTTSGSEVDVILEKPDGTLAAIEIKAGATVHASDFAAIKSLQEQIRHRFCCGVVLYLGEQVVPFGENLFLVPVNMLWAP